MLQNSLCLLVAWVHNFRRPDPSSPVFFTHKQGKDVYSIIVQRMPEQEAAVA